jgi:hypothetical protein
LIKIDRRDFLAKVIVYGGGALLASGIAYKSCIEELIDFPEKFSGFQEKAEDGWKVKKARIYGCDGDVIDISPADGSKSERKVLCSGDIEYYGVFAYEIKKNSSLIPAHPTEYQREQLKSGDFWCDVRDGYVVLTKKK